MIEKLPQVYKHGSQPVSVQRFAFGHFFFLNNIFVLISPFELLPFGSLPLGFRFVSQTPVSSVSRLSTTRVILDIGLVVVQIPEK